MAGGEGGPGWQVRPASQGRACVWLTPRKFLKGGTSPQLPSFPLGVWCSHTNAAEVSLATLWLSLCPPSPPRHPHLSLHRDLLPRARQGHC